MTDLTELTDEQILARRKSASDTIEGCHEIIAECDQHLMWRAGARRAAILSKMQDLQKRLNELDRAGLNLG